MSRLHQNKLVNLQSIVLELQYYNYRFLIALATQNGHIVVLFVLGMETKKEKVFREKLNTTGKDHTYVQL